MKAALALAGMVGACVHDCHLDRHHVGPTPVLLTVSTSPPTLVTVKRAGTEKILGMTPLWQVPGANVGDTVVMTNADAGFRAEEAIEFGSPGEVKTFNRVFLAR